MKIKIMGKKNSMIILFLVVFTGIIVSFKDSPNSGVSNIIVKNKLKTSDFWDLPYKVVIDNNWSDIRDIYDWCYGFANIPSDSNPSKYMLKPKMPKSEKITITPPKIIEY